MFRPQPLFTVILLSYLFSGGLYASLTPAWQSPDEPAHYNYVRHLAREGSLPILANGCYDQAYLSLLTSRRFPPELAIAPLCYEFHQPPLYYLLAVPVFVISDGSLLALRLFSLLLGAGTVSLAFFIAQTIFPSRLDLAYGTMAFVAFIPMHLAILASVNNDALAGLIWAALLWSLCRRLITGSGNVYGLGLLLGLALLTKMTIYIALVVVAVALVTIRQGARDLGLIYGLALIIALPWYIRNGLRYGNGDIFGLQRHDEIVVGQLRTADRVAEVGWLTHLGDFFRTTFHSFWGQFGWMAVPMDSRVYLVLTLVTLVALGGFILWSLDHCRREKPITPATPETSTRLTTAQHRALAILGLNIVLTGLAYSWYNWQFVQFQGRYLFPAIIPLGLFFSLGLTEIYRDRRLGYLIAGLGLAFLILVGQSLWQGDWAKWHLVTIGLPLGLMIGRGILVVYGRWSVPASWLMGVTYLLLAGLTMVVPGWFIVPHLSP